MRRVRRVGLVRWVAVLSQLRLVRSIRYQQSTTPPCPSPQEDIVEPGGQHALLVHQVPDATQHGRPVVLLRVPPDEEVEGGVDVLCALLGNPGSGEGGVLVRLGWCRGGRCGREAERQ